MRPLPLHPILLRVPIQITHLTYLLLPGVGFTFFGARKVDRNEFYLAIDSGEQFIVYQGTGGLGSTLDNSWPTESLYTSPELAYGLHSVVMSQANYSQAWLVAQEWAYAVRDVLCEF